MIYQKVLPKFMNKKHLGENSSLLYENKDGFIIEKRLGDIDYFVELLKSSVKNYGLTKSPDHEEFIKIIKIIKEYISTEAFDRALGYPIYPNTFLLYGIKRIVNFILTDNTQNLKTIESYRLFYESILDMIKEEEKGYLDDILTR